MNRRKFVVVYISSLIPLPRDHKELLKLACLSSSHHLSVHEQKVYLGNIPTDHAWKMCSQTISYQVVQSYHTPLKFIEKEETKEQNIHSTKTKPDIVTQVYNYSNPRYLVVRVKRGSITARTICLH